MIYRQSFPSHRGIPGPVVCSGHEFEPINAREEQCIICDLVRRRQDLAEEAELETHRRPPSHIFVNGRVACIMHDFVPLTIRQERCHVCGFVRERQDAVDPTEAATYRPPPSHTTINGRIACFMHDFESLNATEARCRVCGFVCQHQERVGS